MLTQNAAVKVDDLPRLVCLRSDLSDNAGIVAIGDETDILTIGLVSDSEAKLLRKFPRAGLRPPP